MEVGVARATRGQVARQSGSEGRDSKASLEGGLEI